MTNKNPMDLARKLKKYHQWVKVSRRGLQVRLDHPHSKNPDFALGTYQVKANSDYTLLINTDIPRQAEYLKIEIYGLNSHNHIPHGLSFINQGRVYLRQRDNRIQFTTYPKTRFVFITAKMIYPDLEESESKKPTVNNYSINYLFLESKYPVPRGSETPQIPNSLELEYHIECSPRVIQEIDLQPSNFLKEFHDAKLTPINLDLFEQPLINYLMQKELSPSYLQSLIKNIKSSKSIKVDKPGSNKTIPLIELQNLQQEIKKAGDKLESFLVKVDNLTNQKSTLEVNLTQSSHHNIESFIHQDLETNIEVHREMEKQLNLKFHHLESLNKTHNQNNITQSNSQSAIYDLIKYYQSRVLHDLEIVKYQMEKLQVQEEKYNQQVIQPHDRKENHLQNDLDNTLLDYRKARKTCLVIKEHLDEKISKFVSMFYQYVVQQNIQL